MRLDSAGGLTGLEGSRCPNSHVWKLALLLANITSATSSWPKQVTRPGFKGAKKKALSLELRNGKVTLQRGRRVSVRGKQTTAFWKTILILPKSYLFIFIPGKCFLC